MIVKPQHVDMEQILPVSARPRGLSDSMLPRVEEDFAAKEVNYQYERI